MPDILNWPTNSVSAAQESEESVSEEFLLLKQYGVFSDPCCFRNVFRVFSHAEACGFAQGQKKTGKGFPEWRTAFPVFSCPEDF